MSIVSINIIEPGMVGVAPRQLQMVSTDNLATITTAGYLNAQGQVLQGYNLVPTDVIMVIYSYVASTNTGTFGIFTPSISSGVVTLVQWANPGDVLLPVVSGDFATFNGTTGQIKDAGYLPSNAAKTVVVMANAAVTTNALAVFADTAGTLKNASTTATLGQSLSVTGSVTGSTGIVATTGNVTATAGNLVAGNAAGGNNANMQLFPTTASRGSLRMIAADNTGNFNVDLTNAAYGQASVLTFNDIGASTGGIPVATAPFIMKQVAQAAVAGGAAAQTVTDAFCTTGSNVIAVWNDTTNAVDIQKVAAGNGSFVVTSSGDPGASHLNYIIMK